MYSASLYLPTKGQDKLGGGENVKGQTRLDTVYIYLTNKTVEMGSTLSSLLASVPCGHRTIKGYLLYNRRTGIRPQLVYLKAISHV